MNFNDVLFGSRSVADLPPELQAALMPPGILSAPQPDLNQYGDVTGPSTLSPDINQYRPDGSQPLEVSMSDYPANPAVGVMPGTQLGPSQEGVPGPGFGSTMPNGGAVGAPYSGAEVVTGEDPAAPQGSPVQAPVAAPAAPTAAPPLAAPVNVASRPVMSTPIGSPAPAPTPTPAPAAMADGGSDGGVTDGILKGGKGILDYMYQQVGGDRLWNSKQGSKELLALGAGILSGSNFMDGLGRGAAAVAAIRANDDRTARQQADDAWERNFREKQLAQQAELARQNQALRMEMLKAQLQGKSDASTAKSAETIADLDSGIGQVQGFLKELDGTYKYDGVTGKISYEWNKAVDPADPNFRLKKRLNEFATQTMGELAKNFKPLSNEETKMLRDRVPNESSSVDEWKDYLNRINTVMQRQRRALADPKGYVSGNPSAPQAPQAAPQGADPLGLRR